MRPVVQLRVERPEGQAREEAEGPQREAEDRHEDRASGDHRDPVVAQASQDHA